MEHNELIQEIDQWLINGEKIIESYERNSEEERLRLRTMGESSIIDNVTADATNVLGLGSEVQDYTKDNQETKN